MENLGELPGSSTSGANGISADGGVIVGQALTIGDVLAFRWTRAAGMQELGVPRGGADRGAEDVSADGNVIAGTWKAPTGDRAFRWTSAKGPQDLGLPSGATRARAAAISPDGSVIVGFVVTAANEQRPSLWTAASGMQDLRQMLIDQGLGAQLVGWNLTQAQAVTVVNGEAHITGTGGHNGQGEAYFAVVRLPDNRSRLLWEYEDGRISIWTMDVAQQGYEAVANFGPYRAEGWGW